MFSAGIFPDGSDLLRAGDNVFQFFEESIGILGVDRHQKAAGGLGSYKMS